MILWFLDRFGLPGSYYKLWLNLLHQEGIPLNRVRTISLHSLLKQQLLERHGTRKAPTWKSNMGPIIIEAIDSLVAQHKPEVVVLAAPESLACLGLHPDHATLHTLRGSVYWRSGVPFLVTLPMSAWLTLVSQKEIGAANYGFESQDKFAEGRGGTIHLEANKDSIVAARPVDSTGSGSVRLPDGAGVSAGVADSDAGADSEERGGGESLHGDLYDESGRLSSGSENRGSTGDGSGADGVRDDPEEDGGSAEDESESDVDEDTGRDGDNVREDSDSDADPESERPTGLDADEEVDRFFYEPVLSPVGRFVITADVQKLRRLLEEGRTSKGPKEPLTLRYR